MKTRTMFVVSAAGLSGLAFYSGNATAGIMLLVGHAISWQIHVLEVKVNRLLDENRIYVSDREIAE